MTLLFRRTARTPRISVKPFRALGRILQGKSLLTARAYWMNILLFVPFGLLLAGWLSFRRSARGEADGEARSLRPTG